MPARTSLSTFTDQRGIALPLAIMLLMILASITMAFLAMSASEPQISANLQGGVQALALADAGVEEVMWAADHPSVASGLPSPLPSPVPAPYNGSQLIALGPGVYQMSVSAPCPAVPCPAGSSPADRAITSTGYTLRSGAQVPAAPPVPQADLAGQRILRVTVTSLRNLNPPCALCVAGTVSMSGSSTADARNANCGRKTGVSITSTSPPGDTNSLMIGGAAKVYGNDGNNTPNQPSDYTTNLTQAQFAAFSFTQDELNLLKSIAKSRGTYVQPTSGDTILWQASDWNPSTSDPSYATKPKDGLIFVDTVNGQSLGPPGDPGNPSKLASLKISGTSTGGNSGWLIVMGSLTLDGNITYKGLVYVMNDIVYHGTGTGSVQGAMISQNIVDSVQTVVDTTVNGNADIIYNCDYVKNGNGFIPTGYFVKPGTWQEVSG